MEQKKPRIKKTRKQPNNEKQGRDPPQMAVGWGRAGSLYRPGLFTKQYFEKHGEACAADIYYALSQEIERLNKERVEIGEKPFRRPNYSSFSRSQMPCPAPRISLFLVYSLLTKGYAIICVGRKARAFSSGEPRRRRKVPPSG